MALDSLSASGPAGIPNFAWVDGRLVARGRQPPLTHEAYQELKDFGITAVLSLRPEREYPDEELRRYDAADERALCASLGLTFLHVAFNDYQAPHPSEVVQALSTLRRGLAAGQRIYMHCFAGVGRTGVISGAWQMLHGASGTEALQHYAAFYHEAWGRVLARRAQLLQASSAPAPQPLPIWNGAVPESPIEWFRTVGAHHQAWVLLTIAKALGLPAEPPMEFVRPQRPANGKGWERRFRDQLRRHLPVSPDRPIAARDQDTV